MSDALQKVGTVADYINQKKKQSDNLMRMLVIQSKMSGSKSKKTVILQPGRTLIHEGELHQVVSKKGKLRKKKLFLFNDVIMISKKKEDSKHNTKELSKNKLLDLGIEGCSVCSCDENETKMVQKRKKTEVRKEDYPIEERKPEAAFFKLVWDDKVYIWNTSSMKGRDEWVSKIAAAIKSNSVS